MEKSEVDDPLTDLNLGDTGDSETNTLSTTTKAPIKSSGVVIRPPSFIREFGGRDGRGRNKIWDGFFIFFSTAVNGARGVLLLIFSRAGAAIASLSCLFAILSAVFGKNIQLHLLGKYLARTLFIPRQKVDTSLCQLIDFQQNDNEGIDQLVKEIRTLWKSRGPELQKEDCAVLSVFGIKGQGKTELCHQVLHCKDITLDDIDYFVKIHVTFGQTTSYPVDDVERDPGSSILDSFIWRIFFSFDSSFRYPSDWKQYQGISTDDLLEQIRSAVCKRFSISANKVGILILVDETMRIETPDKMRMLLNHCADLQQSQLTSGFATMFMFTSLQYAPIKDELMTKSGRPVHLIPLTVMSDGSLSQKVDVITAQLNHISSIDDENLRKRLENSRLLRHYVSVVVWTAGKHFRSLERMLDVLYHIIVPEDRHFQALTRFEEGDRQCQIAQAFRRSVVEFSLKQEELSGLCKRLERPKMREHVMKQLFLQCSKDAMSSLSLHKLFDQAMVCFNRLLINPDGIINELEFFDLESEGILFVKWRNPSMFSEIIPRITLPFLYSYAAHKLSVDGLRNNSTTTNPVPLLLNNIARSLNGVDEKLPSAFEKAMFNAELLHYYAKRETSPTQTHVYVSEIMKYCVIYGWTGFDHQLVFRDSLLQNNLQLVASLTNSHKSSYDNALLMIGNSKLRSDVVIFGQDDSAITELIEYVGCHMSALEQDRRRDISLLCSMKLREASAITSSVAISLAKSIHDLAKAANLERGSYYVVLYCCTPRAKFWEQEGVPEGTMFVPFEDVRNLLHPFGASFLLVQHE